MSKAVVPGSSIVAARALLDWTQADLAAAAGMHVNSVAYWERALAVRLGPFGPTTPQRLFKALKAAGVEVTPVGVQFTRVRELA